MKAIYCTRIYLMHYGQSADTTWNSRWQRSTDSKSQGSFPSESVRVSRTWRIFLIRHIFMLTPMFTKNFHCHLVARLVNMR